MSHYQKSTGSLNPILGWLIFIIFSSQKLITENNSIRILCMHRKKSTYHVFEYLNHNTLLLHQKTQINPSKRIIRYKTWIASRWLEGSTETRFLCSVLSPSTTEHKLGRAMFRCLWLAGLIHISSSEASQHSPTKLVLRKQLTVWSVMLEGQALSTETDFLYLIPDKLKILVTEAHKSVGFCNARPIFMAGLVYSHLGSYPEIYSGQ